MPKSDVTAPKERDVLRQVLDLLTLLKIRHWRQNCGAVRRGDRYVRFGVKGLPDVIAVAPRGPRRGLFIGLEVKAPGGRLRPEQRAVLDNLTEDGALALVVRSPEELLAALRLEGVIL